MSNFAATSTTENESIEQAIGRVLIVDDDAKLCDLLVQYLTRRNFVVDSASDGISGLQRAWQGPYDLMILDVMLPGIDGFEVLRRLRAGNGLSAHIPVLMLTAHNDEVDRIVGLELGADDYLSKPFNPRELLARIRAILRRASLAAILAQPPVMEEKVETPAEPTVQTAIPKKSRVDDIEVNQGMRTVTRGGDLVNLTATEFELLVLLLEAPEKIVTREEIARDVLQRELLPFDRSLDMHISKLRRKLGPSLSGAERIKTVRSIGYIYSREKAS